MEVEHINYEKLKTQQQEQSDRTYWKKYTKKQETK